MKEIPITDSRYKIECIASLGWRNPEISLGALAQEDIKVEEAQHSETQGRCAEFVFGETMKEPWILGETVPVELWTNAIGFLISNGYSEVNKPQDGDIVAYAKSKFVDERKITPEKMLEAALRKINKEPPQFMHFGIFRQGRIISKFGKGPIMIHHLDEVPISYGNLVYFFRKVPVSDNQYSQSNAG